MLRAGIALAATLGAPRAWGGEPLELVYVQPLGQGGSETELALVERALRSFYSVEVRRLPYAELPRSAYYRPRARFRAEKLLDFLAARLPEGADRIVGVTARDISTTKRPHADWGILGLATLGGPACVVSSFRCRRGARGAAHARVRLAKVAVHELAHTFGLDHCATEGCLLADGAGSVLTVDREHDLCAATRAALEAGGLGAGVGEIPWAAPRR